MEYCWAFCLELFVVVVVVIIIVDVVVDVVGHRGSIIGCIDSTDQMNKVSKRVR